MCKYAAKIIKLNKATAAEIEDYRSILRRACSRSNKDYFCNEVLETLEIINSKQIHQLTDELFLLLEVAPIIKASLIETLGIWLQIPSFKDHAFNLFMQ